MFSFLLKVSIGTHFPELLKPRHEIQLTISFLLILVVTWRYVQRLLVHDLFPRWIVVDILGFSFWWLVFVILLPSSVTDVLVCFCSSSPFCVIGSTWLWAGILTFNCVVVCKKRRKEEVHVELCSVLGAGLPVALNGNHGLPNTTVLHVQRTFQLPFIFIFFLLL